ncbi:MAG: hypothetical protein H0X46_08300 [Bacteroidetes bacterium]|nr:hypothetical protein [Bacteroidota bacterium]
MKKGSIAFPLLMITVAVSAQEPPDLSPLPQFKKNELSVNTAPVFKMLLNTGPSQAIRFSIMYKHNLNERSALRFSIKSDRIDDDAFNFDPWTEHILLSNDTVVSKQRTVHPQYYSSHLNFGYERSFGKHIIKWFYGADLSAGYAESSAYRQSVTLIKDTAQGGGWTEPWDFKGDVISTTNDKIISVGITPFCGVKYPISKCLSVSAQVGVDMFYKNVNRSETEGNTTKRSRFSTFDFNQNTGFLNDISLIYKF